MDLSPLLNELSKQSPNREIVIVELDVVTDVLRAGFETTPLIDELYNLYYLLIKFNQWHIQQYALSTQRYIFENSKLTKDQIKEALFKHSDFTSYVGVLLSDAKREVREMAAQCIGHLTIQLGTAILDEKLGLRTPIFSPSNSLYAFEGSQMALGRLATAIRIISTPDTIESNLQEIFKHIIDDSQFSVITNQSENGYVFWYSTRSLLLLLTDVIDPTFSQYSESFLSSGRKFIESHAKEALECAQRRLGHHYINTRASAASVICSLFSQESSKLVSDLNSREEFIMNLLPAIDDKWILREGKLRAISECFSNGFKETIDIEFAQSICEMLTIISQDSNDNDNSPVTQKTNANAWAGRALVSALTVVPPSLRQEIFKTYVLPVIESFLDSPYATLLDAGVICISKLQNFDTSLDIENLLIKAFKNVCHASFPIRDLAARVIPTERLVNESKDAILDTLITYGKSEDDDVRESVCKALQIVARLSGNLPESALEMAIELSRDSSEPVSTAAIDAIRLSLATFDTTKVSEIVRVALEGDGDESLVAALKLLKHTLAGKVNIFDKETDDTILDDMLALTPLLAFQAISSMSPGVQGAAQQLLIQMSGPNEEIDEELLQDFMEIDPDSASPEDYEDLIEKCRGNQKAPSSFLSAVVGRLGEDAESSQDALDQLQNEPDDLIKALEEAEKAESVLIASKLLPLADKLNDEKRKVLLQKVADLYADENVAEKVPLLIGLDVMRRLPIFAGKQNVVPDPTPVSTSHLNEGFAKNKA